jgi:hypothetical protein
VAVALASLALLLLASACATSGPPPPDTRPHIPGFEGRVVGWQADFLKLGELAPDFELELLRADDPGRAGQAPRERVRLSAFAGVQPVALVFGSAASPGFAGGLAALEQVHERHRKRVAFLLVYIKAPDSRALQVTDPGGQRDGVAPTRLELARAYTRAHALVLPWVVDGPDDATASAYNALPERLYLIGRDGRVSWKSPRGAPSSRLDGFEQAIRTELEREPADD